jgi:DNA-binding transcriptional LysR family regulator
VLEILTLVAAGPGACLVPSAVARHYPRSDVASVPVDDAEPALVSLAWRAGALIPPLVAFIETVRDVAARTSAEPPAGGQAADSNGGSTDTAIRRPGRAPLATR